MRKRSILLTSALASLALLSACGNNSGENNTQSATNDSLITSLPLSMNIKSAEKSYKITSNDPNLPVTLRFLHPCSGLRLFPITTSSLCRTPYSH